jgi:cystathionine beta-lyase
MYLKGNVDLVRARVAELPGVALIEPEGTFLLWLDFRGLGLGPEDLTTFLRRKAGWAITRGTAFGQHGAGFGRLNIACPKANLSAALDDLQHAIQERHQRIP